MSICPSTRPKREGFTLIEVLLATAIFSIVLVAINTVFFATLRLRQRVSAAVDESLPINQALSILRRDLQNVVPPGGVLAGNFRSGASGSGLGTSGTASGNAASATASRVSSNTAQLGGFDFFTSTGLIGDDAPWGDLQEVNYQLSEPADRATALGKDLVRSVSRNNLSFSTQTPETQLLANNIESFEVEFYDGTQWRDTWDTSSSDSTLPKAVRVRILPAVEQTLASVRREPLEILVALRTSGGTNQVQSAGGSQ
jgi:prepilin-type N-terminal cleavage/methylation domain-containing protein